MGLAMMVTLVLIAVTAIGCYVLTDTARATIEKKTALQGEDVSLKCSPDLSANFDNVENLQDVDCSYYCMYWSKACDSVIARCSLSICLGTTENTPIRFNVTMTRTSYMLHIANVQPSDGGTYICHTYNTRYQNTHPGGHADVHTVELLVIEPHCYIHPRNAIQIGDDVTLKCTLSTARRVKWLASNKTVLSSRRVTALQQSLVLNVTVREEDNFNIFTCVVVSPHGAYNPNCSVTPLEQIVVSITPEVSNVREGESVVFNCKAKLSPKKPHKYIYTWIVNSKVVSQALNVSSYTFANIRLADDGTRVKCEASVSTKNDESDVAVIYVYPVASTRSVNNAETVEYGVTSSIALSTTRHSDYEVGYETDKPGHGKNGTHVSFIAGGVVAIVVLFVLAIILMVILMKKKTMKNTTQRAGDTEVAGTPPTVTTGQVVEDPSGEEDNSVIYALPLQKGGGNMQVRTLGVSFNTPSSSTAVTSATSSTLETAEAAMSLNGNTESVHDNEVLYALPSQKGGGNIKVRTLINKSSKKSSSSAEGRSSAAIEVGMSANSIANVPDVQTSTATDDEIVYALPSRKGGGYVKARTLNEALKKSSVSAARSSGTVDEKSKTKPTISKISSGQTIDATESDEVVYALPTQKGGGSIKVRTLDGSSKKFSPSATTRYIEPDGHIATRATLPDSGGVQTSGPFSTTKDDEDVYALPSQKGGGHIKVRTLDASTRKPAGNKKE